MASYPDNYFNISLEHVTQTNEKNSASTTCKLTLHADDGYKFDTENGTVHLEYKNQSGITNYLDLNCSDHCTDEKTFYYYISNVWLYSGTGYQMQISGSALISETPTEPVIQNNIPNTTVSYDEQILSYLFTVECVDGFIFDGAQKVTYRDSTGGGVTKQLTIDGTTGTVDIPVDDINLNYPVTFDGATKEKKTDITLVNNIANSTVEYSVTDSLITINVTGTTGGLFVVKPTLSYTDNTGTVQVVELTIDGLDEYKAYCSIDNFDVTGTFTLNGVCGLYCPVKSNLINVTTNAQEYYEQTNTVTITVTAADGTKLQAAECYVYYNETEQETKTVFAEIDETGTTGTITFVTPVAGTVINLWATAIADISFLTKYGTINAYICTDDNVTELSAERFFTDTGGSTAKEVDLGNYIHSIRRYLFEVPTQSTDTVKCGNYTTKVQAYSPKQDIITIDFGSVTIPVYNSNGIDYSNTTINVFIPCTGNVTVDSAFVGKTLHLSFECNVITGAAQYVIKCAGSVIATGNVKPYTDMIFLLSNSNNSSVGGISENSTYLCGLIPYVTVQYHKATTSEYNSTNNRCTVGNCTGLCKFTDVICTVDCTADEKEMILQALQNGVIL